MLRGYTIIDADGHVHEPDDLVAMIDCADPTRQAEFNRSYDEVHAAHVLKTGMYWGALCWALVLRSGTVGSGACALDRHAAS